MRPQTFTHVPSTRKPLSLRLRFQAGADEPRPNVCEVQKNHPNPAQPCANSSKSCIKRASCTAEPELPSEFLNSGKLLVTSVQKLFHGLSKFGLNRHSLPVGTLLMDDAHACADIIRDQCRMRIPSGEPAYDALRTLFAADLEMQGIGTYADICNDKREAFLPVPYWAWVSRETEIAGILSTHANRDSIKFAWPLVKDVLRNCQCVISGAAVEIEPYIAPLLAFGSYSKASHRVFMSATVTDDAFLVKGLQLSPETITNPLSYAKETWSGEKMVLIPSLIHEELDRERIVKGFAGPRPKRRHGFVALTPGFNWTKDWSSYGAVVATKETLWDIVDRLKKGSASLSVLVGLIGRLADNRACERTWIGLPGRTCGFLELSETAIVG